MAKLASIVSADDFLAVLEKSALLSSDQVQEARAWNGSTPDAKSMAVRLVKEGRLTKWQAGQLLGGLYSLTLGNYKLFDQIGKGESGRLFLGEHTQMGRRVKIRTLARELSRQHDVVEQFLSHARQAAALDHRNIIHVYDVSGEDDRYYVVMEHVEGRNLEQIVSEGGVAIEKAVDYIRQAAEGLDHAHGKSVVHGDIKPTNLLVDTDGVLKILEIGVAHVDVAAANSNDSSMSLDDSVADFISPEQAEGATRVDASSDIYSLGCTMYFLLTGRPPFPSGTAEERRQAHLTKSPREISELRPDVPDVLVKVVKKLMSKKPENRFPNTKSVAEFLDKWQKQNGPASNRDTDASLADTSVVEFKISPEIKPEIKKDKKAVFKDEPAPPVLPERKPVAQKPGAVQKLVVAKSLGEAKPSAKSADSPPPAAPKEESSFPVNFGAKAKTTESTSVSPATVPPAAKKPAPPSKTDSVSTNTPPKAKTSDSAPKTSSSPSSDKPPAPAAKTEPESAEPSSAPAAAAAPALNLDFSAKPPVTNDAFAFLAGPAAKTKPGSKGKAVAKGKPSVKEPAKEKGDTEETVKAKTVADTDAEKTPADTAKTNEKNKGKLPPKRVLNDEGPPAAAGVDVEEDESEEEEAVAQAPAKTAKKGKKRKPVKQNIPPWIYLAGAIGLAVVAILVVVIVLLMGRGDKKEAEVAANAAATSTETTATTPEETPATPTEEPTEKPAAETENKTPAEEPKPEATPTKDPPKEEPKVEPKPPAPVAKPEPEKPAETPAPVTPEVPAPQPETNRFKGFLSNVSLPDVNSTDWRELGPVDVQSEDEFCNFKLFGGEKAGKGGTLEMRNGNNGNSAYDWDILVKGSTLGDVVLAKLKLKDKKLAFQWTPQAPGNPTYVNLQNCALGLQLGVSTHNVLLRPATDSEPLTVDLQKGASTVKVKLDHVPAAELLKIKVTPQDGFPKHRLEPASLVPGKKLEIKFDGMDKVLAAWMECKVDAKGIELKLTTQFRSPFDGKIVQFTPKTLDGFTAQVATMQQGVFQQKQFIAASKMNEAQKKQAESTLQAATTGLQEASQKLEQLKAVHDALKGARIQFQILYNCKGTEREGFVGAETLLVSGGGK